MGKIMEIPGGRGSNVKPSGTENPVGLGGQTRKNPPWGGMDIFWNHTLSSCLVYDHFIPCAISYSISLQTRDLFKTLISFILLSSKITWNEKAVEQNEHKPDSCRMDWKDFIWLRKHYIAIFFSVLK